MKKYIFICVLSFLLFSCEKGSERSQALEAMSVNSCTVRSATSEEAIAHSPLRLWIVGENTTAYDGNVCRLLTSLNGIWSLDVPVYVQGQSKGYVYAYFPYDKSATNIAAIPVDMNEQQDLLYSKSPAELTTGKSSISLSLSHALSKIVVTVDGATVKGLLLNSPITGTFNVLEGSFTNTTIGTVLSSSSELFVIPHTNAISQLNISLSNGKDYIYSISNSNFMEEKSYVYNFILNENREQLTLQTVTIQPWIEETYQDYL